ncbi:MAG: phage terminase large subunit [Deltaproteobacteria bacterium]|nr:phage terminase large subunit [Deltaproteobacteria bacterium]
MSITSQWEALAKIDYSFYVEYVHRGKYQHAKHTEYICDYLQRVERGEIKRLIVLLPPRHSKSTTISETFPSWFLGRNPDKSVILVCYGDALARRIGRANRRKIEEFGKQIFGVTVSPSNASVTNWSLEGHAGGMISAGIGGPITGQGADLLIIDDPVKNREEAESSTYRERVWEEWQTTLLTRLHPGAAVILVMTHWHEDDLAGRLLSEESDMWELIALPAEAEENDPLGRLPGDPLWPEHGFDAAWLREKKREVGSRTWAALYQQRPAPQEGAILKRHWWQYWHPLDHSLPPVVVKDEAGEYMEITPVPRPRKFDSLLQSWDMAFKDTRESAYVVGQVWGTRDGNAYLLDQFRARVDFVGTIRALLQLSEKWPDANAILIEDKANGPAVISALRQKVRGIIPVQPRGSKIARAYAVSAMIESGNVYIPHPHIFSWVDGYIEECASFPYGEYADQVDATTQALQRIQNYTGRPVAGVWGR